MAIPMPCSSCLRELRLVMACEATTKPASSQERGPGTHLCGWVASQRLYTSLFGGK